MDRRRRRGGWWTLGEGSGGGGGSGLIHLIGRKVETEKLFSEEGRWVGCFVAAFNTVVWKQGRSFNGHRCGMMVIILAGLLGCFDVGVGI